jgi:hypothetical protein
MSEIIKYEKPTSLEHAIDLAHNQKQWASKMEETELTTMLTKACLNFCKSIGQSNLKDGVFAAGLEMLIDLVSTKYKTLHIDEIRTALKRYAANDSIEVKNFSGSTLSKALSLYVAERNKKILAMRKELPEPTQTELTDEEKKEKLDLFYKTWKRFEETKGQTLFGGFSSAYQLAKDLKLLKFDKSEYWAYIEDAKVSSLENLKNLQVSRAISGVVYNNRVNEINAITFESVFKEKNDLPNEVIAECRRLAILDYFRLRLIEETETN